MTEEKIGRDCKASMKYVGTELDGAKKWYVCTNYQGHVHYDNHNF